MADTPTPDPEREAETARPDSLQPETPASTGPDREEVAKKLEEMRAQGGPSLPPSSSQEAPRKAASLLDFGARTEREAASYDVIRIGADLTLVVPFTTDVQEIIVHWNDEPEIKGYSRCSADGADPKPCVLCQIGRATQRKVLLPVYEPMERRVGVLMIGANMSPGSLLPQLVEVVGAAVKDRPTLVEICKLDGYKYRVKGTPLPDGADTGASRIAKYHEGVNSGKVDICAVIPTHSSATLKLVPRINDALALRGLA